MTVDLFPSQFSDFDLNFISMVGCFVKCKRCYEDEVFFVTARRGREGGRNYAQKKFN